MLAETGLIEGESATLHWGFTEVYWEKYPRVNLKQNRMFIDLGRLYCSAGVSAGMDLPLYLGEIFCGQPTAVQSRKTMLLNFGKESQIPYCSYLYPVDHGDAVIIKAQKRLEKHYGQAITYGNGH